MKLLKIFILLSITTVIFANEFDKLWYDGNAEISVYNLTEQRYGEPRKGVRIMVFVTEPLRLTTLIKPDKILNDNMVVKVIKLNDIRKFITGIYDYSVMTSIYSAVENKDIFKSGDTVKISFTGQEWCGNVFELITRNKTFFNDKIFSYFETDGNNVYDHAIKENTDTEDNLWILIRELNGEYLGINQNKNIKVINSVWSRRKAHVKPEIKDAVITKESNGKIDTALGKIETNKWTWKIDGKSTICIVEKNYPHRIISFIEPDGSKGVLMKSDRTQYWTEHNNEDINLRKKFNIFDSPFYK